jgi:hypothetical protein
VLVLSAASAEKVSEITHAGRSVIHEDDGPSLLLPMKRTNESGPREPQPGSP